MSFDIREFTDRLCGFPSTAGNEKPAALWVRDRLAELGFETYEWAADGELLAGHPSFPDDPTEVDTDGRYSVAGAFALGDATLDGDDDYPTLVLNGHLDVVPAEDDAWSGDPFEPTRRTTDDGTETLTARGAADMKSGVAACIGAALDLRDRVENGDLALDGRIVVEAVAGEEDGGYGAATAALRNPYPFDRDAAVVAEPTHLRPVVATEGCLMKRLELTGRSAHAATRWVGEDVLPRFERIRAAFTDLESERATAVTHPLYGEFPVPWPVVCGRVEAGSWASSVPAALWAEFRIGVAPGETVDEVESQFEDRLAETIADDQWLREHPPRFERFSVQFEPAEIDPDERVVTALREGMAAVGVPDAEPEGRTYGADSRHYIEAGIPAVVFGPGRIEQAHFPDETIEWAQVETARETFVATAAAFLD